MCFISNFKSQHVSMQHKAVYTESAVVLQVLPDSVCLCVRAPKGFTYSS